MECKFTWSAEKAKSNLAKHGISFETAQRVFADPYLIVVEDHEDEQGELRYRALGHAGAELLLLVVFVDRSHDGQEVIRIISAWKAGAYEKSTYTDQF